MNALNKNLQNLHASLTTFYANVKNIHWNLKGKNFLIIHKYTDKLAAQTLDFIDEVAEKIVMLGGIALNLQETKVYSDLDFYNSMHWHEEKVWISLGYQIELILKICKKIQTSDSEQHFFVTPLIDELVLYYHKELWTIYAHTQ
ncbi:Dps family protein [Mesomycoplasma conjunctivae]|uniref:Dps family protein n=1 Tax=Mesomycoplasma conjunctivae TaxID=45361 RepID=UPI003DA69034